MRDDLSPRLKSLARRMHEQELELGPKRRESELAAFERTHGVTLPTDYRRFLLEIGDGCVDGPPAEGLLALGRVPDEHYRSADEALARLREPFTATETWIRDDEPDADGVDRGALVLGTDGDGAHYLLIVTGPARGQVWSYADVAVAPLDPPVDFLGWVEDWLAAAPGFDDMD